MTLSRANSLGWAFGEKLTSAQMNALDVQIPYALDGHAGGSYSPSSAIQIGGSGLIVSGSATLAFLHGNMTLNGTSTVTSNAATGWAGTYTFSDTVILDTPSTVVFYTADVQFSGFSSSTNPVLLESETFFYKNIVVDGTGTVTMTFENGADLILNTGSDLTVGGALIANGTLAVGAAAIFTSGVTVFGNFLASGTSSFTANATFTNANITMSGTSHINQRVSTGADSNTTWNISQADLIRAPGLSVARDYRFSSTNAVTGSMIEISVVGGAAHNLAIIDDDSSATLATLNNSAGNYVSCKIVFQSGAWKLFSRDTFD